MQISIKNLLAIVTIAALICIVGVQNYRTSIGIATLESKLHAREVELAKLALVLNAFASAPLPNESNEFVIGTLPLFLANRDLLIKHKNDITETANMYRGYDPDPAVRARQLIMKIDINETFIDNCINDLIERADAETLEYIKFSIQSDPRFEFEESDHSARRQKFDIHIQKMNTAIKHKTPNESKIAG